MIDLNEVGNLPRVGPQAPLPMFSPGRRPPLIIARDQEPSEPGQNQPPFHGAEEHKDINCIGCAKDLHDGNS